MKKRCVVIVCFCCAMFAVVASGGVAFGADTAPTSGAASVSSDQWAAWRGPEATGVARHADPPVKWDEKTNVKWKKEIPGVGHASPIVWKDRVIVLTSVPADEKPESGDQKPATDDQKPKSSDQKHGTDDPKSTALAPAKRSEAASTSSIPSTSSTATAAPARRGPPLTEPSGIQKFEVLCLDRKDGSVVWQRTVAEKKPHAGTHADGSWASGSPVTDGERIYASFGSNGLYCLDMNGKPLWDKDLGQMKIRMNFGEGSSPVLYGDTLVLNWDQEGDSFIVAFNKKTGDQLWRVPRDERSSWNTPAIVEVAGKPQVITNGAKRIRSYNLATGDLAWECGGMTENPIPSPVSEGGLAWIMSGFRGSALVCVDLAKAKGDITSSTAVLWKHNRDTPYVPSPLLYDGSLYFLKGSTEFLSCFDAKTGKAHYTARKIEELKGVYSSPVGAKGRVYITGRNGATVVLALGPEYKVLSMNPLDDSFTASAALAGKEIFLRGHKALYCIAEP